jgi:nitrate reductase molybdenum cofactor assembly chaperone NarJ/NarW
MSLRESYLGLARLLSYPEEKGRLLEACDVVALHFKEGSSTLPFETWLRGLTLSALQENYVASFDFNPRGSLYLGHHLHGDNQQRAAFMISLKQEFARHGFSAQGNELPDHLAVLLVFLAHLAQRGEHVYRREFITTMVLPGLGKMSGTDPAGREPAWQALVDAARMLCSADGIGKEDSRCSTTSSS